MHDSYNVDDSNQVTIEGIELPDGRLIDAIVYFDGQWDDNAFDYEYGSIRGTHRYDPAFQIESYNVQQAWVQGTQTPVELTPELVKLISAEFESIEDEVEAKVDSGGPPSNEPDPDDERDRRDGY